MGGPGLSGVIGLLGRMAFGSRGWIFLDADILADARHVAECLRIAGTGMVWPAPLEARVAVAVLWVVVLAPALLPASPPPSAGASAVRSAWDTPISTLDGMQASSLDSGVSLGVSSQRVSSSW